MWPEAEYICYECLGELWEAVEALYKAVKARTVAERRTAGAYCARRVREWLEVRSLLELPRVG